MMCITMTVIENNLGLKRSSSGSSEKSGGVFDGINDGGVGTL
jgi:hypothetical protein